jgi:hypothetical protein
LRSNPYPVAPALSARLIGVMVSEVAPAAAAAVRYACEMVPPCSISIGESIGSALAMALTASVVACAV